MRYSDSGHPDATRSEDFQPRKRIPTFIQFLILFGVNFFLVLIAYIFSKTMVGFALAVFCILAVVDAVTVWSVQRSRDLLLVTEFQNALFGAAISLGTMFSLIIRKDGSVEYVDRGFRNLFPNYAKQSTRRTLEEILQMASVSREDADKLYGTLSAVSPEQHVITLRDSDGMAHKVVLIVDPLRRPQDYVLLRGRAFVENRT